MAEANWEELGPGLWRRRGDGPRLAVVGGMHGDESAGAAIIEILRRGEPALWQRAPRADVTLAIGNPEALRLGERQTPAGTDLNRLFGEDPGRGETYEHGRAAALREALRGVELLVDLHQTTCTTPPVAVAPDSDSHLRFAAALGVQNLVTGMASLYGGTMLSEWVDAQGGIGLTVETGQKGSAEAEGAAYEIIRRFLTAGSSAPRTAGRIRVYRFAAPLPCPGPGLRFTRRLGNTSRIRQGEVLGTWDGGELCAAADGSVFLPREDAPEGAPCLLLTQDEGWRSVPAL